MTIRIKMRGDKAIIRFRPHTQENLWFQEQMLKLQQMPPPHPKIVVNDASGREIKPVPEKKVIPLTDEQIRQIREKNKDKAKINITPIGKMPPTKLPEVVIT